MAERPTGAKRGTYKTSEVVRRRLIDAARTEFAIHGFEGASTRAIARRADAHQPQINYHFESKDALWRAVMDALMAEIDEFVRPGPDVRSTLEELIRGIVRFSAARPELNRIMISEASAPGPRLTWLIETHLGPRYRAFRAVLDEAQGQGIATHVPADLAYHLMIGAASLLHANAPEAEELIGIRAADPAVVDAHVDAMIAMFLGPA